MVNSFPLIMTILVNYMILNKKGKYFLLALNLRTYNPNKGCKHLTQRRKGVEKARKENLFKKPE